jgi:hypothetical protein
VAHERRRSFSGTVALVTKKLILPANVVRLLTTVDYLPIAVVILKRHITRKLALASVAKLIYLAKKEAT